MNINEIRDNEFNLNVSLYIYPEEETKNIDLKKEWDDLKILTKEIIEIDKKIESYIKELT